MKQVLVRLAAIALTASLGIGFARAADTPPSGTLVPGGVGPRTPAPGAPAPTTATPSAPAPSVPAPETAAPAPDAAAPTPEKPAPAKPAPHKAVQHRPPAKETPRKDAVEKPSGAEEGARTCVHDRLRQLVAEDQRGDVAADAALNACTNDLKAEFKAKKKSYCEAVAYIGWLVADENSKLNGVSGQPYHPDPGFLQSCGKTESWERHR